MEDNNYGFVSVLKKMSGKGTVAILKTYSFDTCRYGVLGDVGKIFKIVLNDSIMAKGRLHQRKRFFFIFKPSLLHDRSTNRGRLSDINVGNSIRR